MIENDKKRAIKLIERAKFILQTKGWTKGVFARTKDNISCNELSDKAVKFCAIGSLYRAQNDLDLSNQDCVRALNAIIKALNAIRCFDNMYDIEFFNDKVAKDKRYIIRRFDKAIKTLKNS